MFHVHIIFSIFRWGFVPLFKCLEYNIIKLFEHYSQFKTSFVNNFNTIHRYLEINKTKELNLSNDGGEEIISQAVDKSNEKKGEGNPEDELGKLAQQNEEVSQT